MPGRRRRRERVRRVRPGRADLAVAYIRVSRDHQRLGPDVQRRSMESWANFKNVTIAAWKSDEGFCGELPPADRPGLQEAIDLVQELGAGILLIMCRDRLARDTIEAALLDRELAKLGAAIICSDGAGNGDEPTERFIRRILDAVAELELHTLRKRTKNALAEKQRRGELVSYQPSFGYRVDPNDPDGARLIPNEDEQRCIRRVLELRAQRTGQNGAPMSLTAIVEVLGREGYRGRTGNPLQKTQVHRIVKAAAARAEVPRIGAAAVA
jgi:DNA invertase Pin-like site-specific DNA recombinase